MAAPTGAAVLMGASTPARVDGGLEAQYRATVAQIDRAMAEADHVMTEARALIGLGAEDGACAASKCTCPTTPFRTRRELFAAGVIGGGR